MTTRSIVTSVPDVACEMCGRRLLRGERPDVFLSGGERRIVCELCAPRASAGGWLREADGQDLDLLPTRSRRSRSLFGRLRQLREPTTVAAHARTRRSVYESEDDLIGAPPASFEDERPAPGEEAGHLTREEIVSAPPLESEPSSRGESEAMRAVEVFNAGEQPRRVAGVSRSLGAPAVTVRPLSEARGKVVIVVAWELCWYRYEVDLDDSFAEPRLLERGMELDELPDEDRLANAAADERGELALLSA
jgi:hypothetical protein